jgi:hypothetical protein
LQHFYDREALMNDRLHPDENPRAWLTDARLKGRGNAVIRSIVSQLLGHPNNLYVNRRTLEARTHEARYDATSLFSPNRDSPIVVRHEVRARLEAILGDKYEVRILPQGDRQKSFILICKLRKKG